jgi:hypothetical protein
MPQTCPRARVRACVHVRACARACVHVRACMRACVCMRASVRARAYVFARVHERVYARVHACVPGCLRVIRMRRTGYTRINGKKTANWLKSTCTHTRFRNGTVATHRISRLAKW